jgi:hypothetical protein
MLASSYHLQLQEDTALLPASTHTILSHCCMLSMYLRCFMQAPINMRDDELVKALEAYVQARAEMRPSPVNVMLPKSDVPLSTLDKLDSLCTRHQVLLLYTAFSIHMIYVFQLAHAVLRTSASCRIRRISAEVVFIVFACQVSDHCARKLSACFHCCATALTGK